MFIQCQHCQATYKIDEQKIPDQDSFVRCAKCSNEIPLGKKAQSALSQQQPKKIVECDNCGIRYSIPIDKIQGDTVPVRCGKCGNVFSVSKDDNGGKKEPIADTETDNTDPFKSEAVVDPFEDDTLSLDIETNNDDIDMENISIPEESEIEMDDLFGDIENDDDDEHETIIEGEDSFSNSVFEDDEEMDESEFDNTDSDDPKKEYLDSVNLTMGDEDESDILDDEMEIDAISVEEKSKLFLQPESSDSNEVAMEGTNWPEIEDETEVSENLTNIESEIAEFGEMDELSAMPDADDDGAGALELQEIPTQKGNNKKWIVFFIVLILILGAATAWFHFGNRLEQIPLSPKTEEFSIKSKLTIIEPLKGKFIINKITNERIFLLEGNLKNIFSSKTRISWIEVSGTLYNKKGEKISESISYAGSKLSDAEFAKYSKQEIVLKLRGSQRKATNLNLMPNQTASFQIGFFDVPDQIQKLEAKISRFGRLEEK